MNGPLVSVIIPVYNVEEYLERCVESVRDQTYVNLEIILVDDGSTDTCPDLCDGYARQDKRITVIHKENRGLGEARNTGIDAAHGEWLCFVDSDDFVHRDFVRVLLRISIDNGCLIAQGRRLCVFDDAAAPQPDEETKVFEWPDFHFYAYHTEGHDIWAAWNNLFHKSLFPGFRFTRHKTGEDLASTCGLFYNARNGKIAVTNQILYYWYQRPQSLSRGKRSVGYFDRIPAIATALSFWEEKGEKGIYDLCWMKYFEDLLNVITECSRDLPQHRDECERLVGMAKDGLGKARETCHEALLVHPASDHHWSQLTLPGKRYVLYGYGNVGRNLLPWLEYFDIDIVEIWDKRAADSETVGNIAIRRAHDGYIGGDVKILLALGNPIVAAGVQNTLSRMGYRDFIPCGCLENAIRYAKYRAFLPFLLEGSI
jgi:glycosyltransferase involved in cell wall biosynthesis